MERPQHVPQEVAHGADALDLDMAPYAQFTTHEQSQAAVDALRIGASLDTLRSIPIFQEALKQEQVVGRQPESQSYEALFERAAGNVETFVLYGHYTLAKGIGNSFYQTSRFIGMPQEDFVAEAFGIGLPKALNRYLLYERSAPFIPYAITVITNHLTDVYRKERNKISVPIGGQEHMPSSKKQRSTQIYLSYILEHGVDGEDLTGGSIPVTPLGFLGNEKETDPEELVQLREILKDVGKNINKLKPRQRELLLWYMLSGLSVQDLAAHYGIDSHTLNMKVLRAKRKAIEPLREKYEIEDRKPVRHIDGT